MKNNIVFALLLIVSAASFSQPVTNPDPTVKTDYLEKSKHQKKAAGMFLEGGGVLFITGLALSSWDIYDGFNPEENRPSIILFLTAATSMLVSVPFFIASSINKRKGMSLSFKNEAAQQIQKSSFVHTVVPSLSLKINL